MTKWFDARKASPTDHTDKLVSIYNTYSHRQFYQVGWFDGEEWHVSGGRVRYWSEFDPAPKVDR